MPRSRSPEERSERRRPRSRSPSDFEEERRRQRRRRDRKDTSSNPRERRRDDRYDSRDRRDKLRGDDRHRESSGSDSRDRDRSGDRHTSDRRTHDRRTHRDGDRHHESRHRRRHSRSPRRRSRDRDSRAREEEPKKIEAYKKASGPLPDQQAAFRDGASASSAITLHPGEEPLPEKEVPNFATTGLLAAATNTIEKSDGTKVVLKYHEPPEARKPSAKDAWKVFVFKGPDIIETIPLAERSCWLIGKELAVVDLPAEHPTISRQHAVIQFRYVEKKNEFGDRIGKVKPYLLDLESANGTFLNGERIEESRFIEIRDKDLIKFGESTREYVVMLPPKE